MEDASAQNAEKQVLVGEMHVQAVAMEQQVASAAVDTKYSEGAYEALVEGKSEIAVVLVAVGDGFDCLAASVVEDFAAEVKLDVVCVVAVEVELVHLAGFDAVLPG